MVFQEPKIEFVSILNEDVIATSGAAYAICEKAGDEAMEQAHFCEEMLMNANMTWAEICGNIGSLGGDASSKGHVSVPEPTPTPEP